MEKIAYLKEEHKFGNDGIACYLGADRDFSWHMPVDENKRMSVNIVFELLQLTDMGYKIIMEGNQIK